MSAPLISVVVPVYNAARYLRSALASIQAQTLGDFELIVVDDGSTDASPRLLAALAAADPRLRVISRPNTGIVGALNDGLAVARGEFVARMDADDLALPQRFEKQIAHLRAHPDCVAVGGDVLFTDPENWPLVRHRPALRHQEIHQQLLQGNGGALIHPSVTFRREALTALGGYRTRYNWIEDLDLFLRLARIGRLANLPDVQLHYRQHLKSVNRTRSSRDELRRELVATARAELGLPAWTPPPAPAEPDTPAAWRRHWAYDAARGGHPRTAQKNALLACLRGPARADNWRCLRYTLTLGRRPAIE